MEIFAYLIKVNIAIILLYGFYGLVSRNDTFFQWKRLLLLSVLVLSLLYPLWDISKQMIENNLFTQSVGNGTIFPTYYLHEVVVTAKSGHGSPAFFLSNHLPEILSGTYFLVVSVLIIRMLIQIFGVVFLLIKAEPEKINGQKIYRKKGLKTPFSFFGYIVLDPDQYTESELQEILRHENTHVAQCHSADMMFAEIMCIVCWFNPFIWLMKREIRINLEYLADRSVIDSGCNTEHYQFHLLRLSYHKAAAKITNNFNDSPLKKRILMMNKKQTSLLGLAKYAFILPLVLALLLFNSLDAISGKNRLPAEPVADTQQKVVPEKKASEVYSRVEEIPLFPGGDQALLTYLKENLTYPASAVKDSIQGRVVIRFVITAEGKVEDAVIQKSLNPACDKEAVRVVLSMPNWIPGKQNGKAVDVYFNLPITFKL
jgi:TonB family protein